MHSDTRFERFLKLLASLLELVVREKRHLETATAILQRIVFEVKGFPKFKVWSEICELGKTSRLMMMTVATVDLDRRDERVEQLIAAFPQCFSHEKAGGGPYPLSVLRSDAEAAGHKGGCSNGGDYLVTFEAVPSDVPCLGFDKHGNNVAGINGQRLPEGIDPDTSQGDIVVWDGKEFVVLENDMNNEELWVAPAECIRVDL